MNYRVEPISDYTQFTSTTPKPSPFDATWTSTLDTLEREVSHLQYGHNRAWADFVIQIDVMANQLRKDGQLKANSVVAGNAVCVKVPTDDKGTLAFPCNRFTHWQDNVRAVALALEALRKVDRYEVGQGRQYAGWAALPAGSGDTASYMTETQAWDVLHELTGATSLHIDPKAVYRRARAAVHPDRNDGDRTAWDQVEQAATVLGLS